MHVSESGDFLHFVHYATSESRKYFFGGMVLFFSPISAGGRGDPRVRVQFSHFAEEFCERRINITCGSEWHGSKMQEVKDSILGFLQLTYSLHLKNNCQFLPILALGNTR